MSERKAIKTAARSLMVLACLACAGCGGLYDCNVSGVVKLDGNVVPRGTVSFAPQGGGPNAYSLIQSDGTYTLRTGREEGLPPGDYTVTVAANEAPSERGKDGGPPPTGKPITPAWYRDPATSGLAFTVVSGDNVFDLDLKSTPPPGWTPARR